VRELRDGEGVPGRPHESVLRLLDPALVAAEPVVDDGERVRRLEVVRVGALPDLERVGRLREVAGDAVVVLVDDEEPLALAHAVALGIGEPRVVDALRALAEVAVDRRQRRGAPREGGIELERALEERDRLDLAAAPALLDRQRVGAQRLERRRRRLLHRHVEGLHRLDRLPHPRAQARGHLAERRQHLLRALGLALLARERGPLAHSVASSSST
jgi:hypothetical protein